MKFIKTHKSESIIIGICILLLLFTLIFLKIFFFSEKSNVYGSRLDGIEDVRISEDKLDKIAIELKKEDAITEVDTNVTGRIVNFIVTVTDTSDLGAVQARINTVLEEFNKKEKEFYDMQIFLISKEETENMYPSIGYKGKSSTEFVWIHS